MKKSEGLRTALEGLSENSRSWSCRGRDWVPQSKGIFLCSEIRVLRHVVMSECVGSPPLVLWDFSHLGTLNSTFLPSELLAQISCICREVRCGRVVSTNPRPLDSPWAGWSNPCWVPSGARHSAGRLVHSEWLRAGAFSQCSLCSPPSSLGKWHELLSSLSSARQGWGFWSPRSRQRPCDNCSNCRWRRPARSFHSSSGNRWKVGISDSFPSAHPQFCSVWQGNSSATKRSINCTNVDARKY